MNYTDYYARAISSHKHGLKLVVGGTGLGKTSAIPKVIAETVVEDRKYIYIANRHQLLKEMEAKLNPTEYRLLPPDFDSVMNTLKLHREALYRIQDDPIFKSASKSAHVDLRAIYRFFDELSDIEDYEAIPTARIREQLERDARRIVTGGFRSILKEIKNNSQREKILDSPVIQSLFPFIAFKRRKEIKILLTTVHKAFYGFFDGNQRINITDLEGHIVFLDEFDFLENNLTSMICAAPQISNVFRFVEFFYREMTRHKLPLPTYPATDAEAYRKKIVKISSSIDKLAQQGIDYPEINQLTRSLNKGNVALFRTNHVVTSTPLYLSQSNRAFVLLDNPDEAENSRVFPAQTLLNQVTSIAEQIITLMKHLEVEHPIIYEEMRQQCYGDTDFDQEIQQITYFPRIRKSVRTGLDALLEYGYSLFDIYQLRQQTDNEEVKLHNYSIYTTPEAIIETLARNNLVFGLSATGDIPRCIHHFDIEWLKRRPNFNLIPIDTDDERIISSLNEQKTAERGNTKVTVVGTQRIQIDNKLEKFIDTVAKDADFGNDTKHGHVKERVKNFFASLDWIAQGSDEIAGNSHLIFLNSFRQIKLIFSRYGDNAQPLFTAESINEQKYFDVYNVTLKNQKLIVVFYNAELARKARKNQEAEKAFHKLFHNGLPVVVVTQYLSAGNGVNLQYLPNADSQKDKDEQDFLNLHLLEVPYFYFGNIEKGEKPEMQASTIKENIWYQAKLYSSKLISEARFKHVLSELHEPDSWNTNYQKHLGTRTDALLNNLAALIQALGRIERTRLFTPRQTVVMSREVMSTFRAYLSDQFDYIRIKREPIISYNLKQVLDQIASQIPAHERQRQHTKDDGLISANRKSREKIGELVNSLNRVRNHENEEIRIRWEQLRESVLRHDFTGSLAAEYEAVYQSSYLVDGTLHLNAEDEIIPELNYDPVNDWSWHLNSVYNVIGDNQIISSHFAKRGYEMLFGGRGNYFFTPYCHQAILTGAIGEEAIKALLRHEHIKLESMPNELYEIADLKVNGKPYYIDCKNYSDDTMARFSLPPDDLYWHPNLNASHFMDRAQDKWRYIAKYHSDDSAKLIYLNLVSRHEASPEFYDSNFNPVSSFDGAKITIVRGCLHSSKKNDYHPAFKLLLHHLQQTLTKE